MGQQCLWLALVPRRQPWLEEKAVAVRLLSDPVERWHVQRLMSVRQETQTLGSLPATRGDIRELEEALSHGPQAAVALGC